ncbi:MAG TPA: hypothetical protein VGI53_01570 [Dyella sp.]
MGGLLEWMIAPDVMPRPMSNVLRRAAPCVHTLMLDLLPIRIKSP